MTVRTGASGASGMSGNELSGIPPDRWTVWNVAIAVEGMGSPCAKPGEGLADLQDRDRIVREVHDPGAPGWLAGYLGDFGWQEEPL